jgi:hypothetical protein
MADKTINCPICETKIDLPKGKIEGKRITCQNCFAQLVLFKNKDQVMAGCAFCKEPVFTPEQCEACERRREKKKIIEEGVL